MTELFLQEMACRLKELRDWDNEIKQAVIKEEREALEKYYWDTAAVIDGMSDAHVFLTCEWNSLNLYNYTFTYGTGDELNENGHTITPDYIDDAYESCRYK